jgi:hypothetical protein
MRESLRIFVYIFVTFVFAIGFAFIIINNIFGQSYFVWNAIIIGFTAIFCTSFVIIVNNNLNI